MKRVIFIGFILYSLVGYAQQKPELTVSKIMQDPASWVGSSPRNPFWSEDGKALYFRWNPEQNPGDSLYKVTAPWISPSKVGIQEQKDLMSRQESYNKSRTKKLFSRRGDIFLQNIKGGQTTQITNTTDNESSPAFRSNETSITFVRSSNLYELNLASGQLTQLTNFKKARRSRKSEKQTDQDEWLEEDQMDLFLVLKENAENEALSREYYNNIREKSLPEIEIGSANPSNVTMNADGKFISYTLFSRGNSKNTIVPNYVTESGYTTDINARSKVGSNPSSMKAGIYDVDKGTSYTISTKNLSGINESPDYYAEYDRESDEEREVYSHAPIWSPDGKKAVITFRSKDNKDRWICLLDPETGDLTELDRQHDDAWIAGPGIGYSFGSGTIGWLEDNKSIYYQSEETGYSHLYLQDVTTKEKKALTSGKFEVYSPRISADGKSWFFEANVEHPGIVQLFKLPLYGGEMTALTSMGGKVDATLSSDNKMVAILHSKSNQPTELYIAPLGKKVAEPTRITFSQTEEWKKYPWREPEFITFEARDGATVYARLYQPENKAANGPAVIFVHGAGYLQNAHQWWSSYFREYMFHNLLADKGYTVLDIDYRGSAGYGRDWRTGIYQHMGGFDLTDQVDGARYLVSELGVDEKKVGLYGGSYGGFITLMAMFTEADTFAAGAALRSVTDWAHYNHGYTSNILNTPLLDSLAYRKSSPIYYAEGLKGALLMCHGMIDTNVHFQDIVRLSQRLIELGKENWELAVYPLESHGFVHPTSWTDEYSRILKLFEANLKD